LYFIAREVEETSDTRCETEVVLTKEDGVKATAVVASPARVARVNFIFKF